MTETELLARLEKLESDNRRLKKIGAAALVLAAALGLMAATRPVPDVVKAHAFEVVPLSAMQWMGCGVVASSVLWGVERMKWMRRNLSARKGPAHLGQQKA